MATSHDHIQASVPVTLGWSEQAEISTLQSRGYRLDPATCR